MLNIVTIAHIHFGIDQPNRLVNRQFAADQFWVWSFCCVILCQLCKRKNLSRHIYTGCIIKVCKCILCFEIGASIDAHIAKPGQKKDEPCFGKDDVSRPSPPCHKTELWQIQQVFSQGKVLGEILPSGKICVLYIDILPKLLFIGEASPPPHCFQSLAKAASFLSGKMLPWSVPIRAIRRVSAPPSVLVLSPPANRSQTLRFHLDANIRENYLHCVVSRKSPLRTEVDCHNHTSRVQTVSGQLGNPCKVSDTRTGSLWN